ncbi:MAG: hypothetical protein ABIG11_01655, partial [bacterium]
MKSSKSSKSMICAAGLLAMAFAAGKTVCASKDGQRESELFGKGLAERTEGRLENSLEIFMDILMENPASKKTRAMIGEVSAEILAKEKVKIDSERRFVLEKASAFRKYRLEKEAGWKQRINEASALPPSAAYDVYLKILYDEPRQEEALAGLEALQESVRACLEKEPEIKNSETAVLKGFYLYCSGNALGARALWNTALKWGDALPLEKKTLGYYISAADSAMRGEQQIMAELASPASPIKQEKNIPRPVAGNPDEMCNAMSRARAAAWNAEYGRAMEEIGTVFDGTVAADSEKNEVRRLRKKIFPLYEEEKKKRGDNAAGHYLRGLVQYSRNRLR